nr:hypothetical protein [Tanacetum cinerariifolium]
AVGSGNASAVHAAQGARGATGPATAPACAGFSPGRGRCARPAGTRRSAGSWCCSSTRRSSAPAARPPGRRRAGRYR